MNFNSTIEIVQETSLAHSRAFKFVMREYVKHLEAGYADDELTISNSSNVTYAMLDGEVVGACVWSVDTQKRSAWIFFSAVHEDHRRKGIYTHIFQKVCNSARARGAVVISSGVHHQNEAMLEVLKKQHGREVKWYRVRKNL